MNESTVCTRISSVWSQDAPIAVGRHVLEDGLHRHKFATHDVTVLTFHVAGRSRIEQRGEWTLERSDVFLVPAGEPHRTVDVQQAEVWSLGFCISCLATDDASVLTAPFERVRRGASGVVRIPPVRHALLETLLRELQSASHELPRAPLSVQRSLLTLILHEVVRAAAVTEVVSHASSIVADSIRFIEQHCLEPLTLRDVAHAVKRTPSYVTTLLRETTGRSAVSWIIASRMVEARKRLLHSDERVEIIAERVGYADATHFIRLFRRTHGVTPTAWRTHNRVSG